MSDDESASDSSSAHSMSDSSFSVAWASDDDESASDAELHLLQALKFSYAIGVNSSTLIDIKKISSVERSTAPPEFPRNSTLDDWRNLGNNLRQSAILKKISLTNCRLTEGHISALFGGREEWASFNTIERIELDWNFLGLAGIAALLPFLKSTPNLEYLSLSGTHMDDQGVMLIAEVLQHIRIKCLFLISNAISGAGVERLLSAKNSIHLQALNLNYNNIGSRGCAAIANFIGRDDTELRALQLSSHDAPCAKSVLDSISKKSKLEGFAFWNSSSSISENEVKQFVVPSLKKVVCNVSSFESLCESNHNLLLKFHVDLKCWDLGSRNYLDGYARLITSLDSDLKTALHINATREYGVSVGKRMRSKLRAFYFRGSFDVQPFVDMDIKLMPKVLELVTKTEVRVDNKEYEPTKFYEVCDGVKLSPIYHMVRNCHLPELFSFPSPELKLHILELENAALKAENASLKKRNDKMADTIEKLQAGGNEPPNKRTKTSSD